MVLFFVVVVIGDGCYLRTNYEILPKRTPSPAHLSRDTATAAAAVIYMFNSSVVLYLGAKA